ncbi:MAG: hypothetical protein GY829_00685 [Gammaproteobacteria bacterium]|nr:hypothetical protein [Gammaproteobacteria bacterium]
MVYGASGYTGQLIVSEAKKRGLLPILAGRSEKKLKLLAAEHDLEYRVFDLSKRVVIAEQLKNIDILLHCAGPFSATAKPMMASCLNSNTHYLDITGEIEVFQHAKQLNKSAIKAGIVLCPGVGFDVIPTDCLAATLKQSLPNATSLWLGFSTRSGLSPGTAKTSVEGLPFGGKVRRKNKVVNVPLVYKVRQIDFGDGTKNAVTIPWGDIATAYYSTEIPNIEVYIPMSDRKVKQLIRLDKIRPILGWQWVQNLLKKQIEKKVMGPELSKREHSPSYIWGEVLNEQGELKTGRLTTANGYDLTATGSLGVVEYLLNTEEFPSGYQTVSQLMGADYVCSLPGSSKITLS